jgi:predicted nucleic acid-binding Zn ribbon protein
MTSTESGHCSICGIALPPKRRAGRPRVYCSRACRRSAELQRLREKNWAAMSPETRAEVERTEDWLASLGPAWEPTPEEIEAGKQFMDSLPPFVPTDVMTMEDFCRDLKPFELPPDAMTLEELLRDAPEFPEFRWPEKPRK